MNKFLLILIIVVTVFLYYGFLEPLGWGFTDLPFLLVMGIFGIYGTREALITAIITGALVDFHHLYFGRYLFIYAVLVVLTDIINRYVLNSQTYRSLLLLYTLSGILYLGLIYFVTGLVIGFKYALISAILTEKLWLVILLSAVLITLASRLKNVLNKNTLHDKQPF